MAPLGRDLRELFERADQLAAQRGQDATSAHLLLALATPGGPADAIRILVDRGVTETALRASIRSIGPERPGAIAALRERTVRIARDCGAASPTPLHLLLALTREPGTAAARCLGAAGCDVGVLRSAVLGALVSRRPALPVRMSVQARASAVAPARDPRVPLPVVRRPAVPPRKPASPMRRPVPVRAPVADLDPRRFPFLTTMGRDLCAAAARGDLDPLVGRAKEIDALLDILHRRNGACPCLVGPSGVGKTAIVHGLARRIAEGDAGEALAGRRLVEVPVGELLAGTGARGSLSERLAGLRREVVRAEGRVLVFLDDVHALLSPESAAEAGAELRSALARGEMQCLAATSPAEWRRTIEPDSGLERRFSRVDVDEISAGEATEVLRGVAGRYAAHHRVEIDDGALGAAVKLSVRWIPGRHLPEKAITVLDLAAARARRSGATKVDAGAIAGVVATLSGAPVERVGGSDAAVLVDLEAHLAERIVGHAASLRRIAGAIRRNAAGFRRGRPIGSFLLLGPTGVGKTETARALADILFPEGGAMTRLDMGEYAEAHALARLVGAPPGYVGHEEGGQLTEAVRRRPYQLVLFDEIEKAHPQVVTALLGLLEDGRMTDGRGRTVDFTNTILVLTSNLGADARVSASVGFGTEESHADRAAEATLAAARRALPPELWNRIDEPLAYAALTRDEVLEVARRMLAATAKALRDEHGVTLEWDAAAPEALVEAGGWDPALGARPMRRTIQRRVEDPLAAKVLRGGLGQTVRLDATLAIV